MKRILLLLPKACVCVCVWSSSSCIQRFATPWAVALQAPLSMRFSRQEYWRGLPCPSPGDLSDPGIKPASLYSCCIADSLHWATRKPPTPRLRNVNKLAQVIHRFLNHQIPHFLPPKLGLDNNSGGSVETDWWWLKILEVELLLVYFVSFYQKKRVGGEHSFSAKICFNLFIQDNCLSMAETDLKVGDQTVKQASLSSWKLQVCLGDRN